MDRLSYTEIEAYLRRLEGGNMSNDDLEDSGRENKDADRSYENPNPFC